MKHILIKNNIMESILIIKLNQMKNLVLAVLIIAILVKNILWNIVLLVNITALYLKLMEKLVTLQKLKKQP